ncbi:hypothetical protein [Caulobacter segnis]|uniref:hypothetical protein n=1 Tax=Caulobacter segnis TaxID=88688 RepID=UPI002859ACC6|nr:hypothetical protein [Caulobacter segnis]MDR6624372.1 hypothetical protein [Caulobacter segnis]
MLAMLREWDPPAGENGFEGLVAQALATFTGLTFRLAKSGSQFGRDGGTPNAPFAIAMEAKRYKDSVPLQELAGKATLAAFELTKGVDLWALAATVEVGEPTERKLEDILERGGIALLTLDWPNTGLPPLAVLLAAVRAEILPWVEARRPPEEVAAFRAGLDDIAADPAFEAQLAQLHSKLSPASLGLDAFRAANANWCEEKLASRQRAQRQFSQFLAPLESPSLTIDRPLIRAAIAQAVETAKADSEGDALVAVLGGEGSGKTWAVANWWVNATFRPILLLSVGRAANNLSETATALDMLSHLAADQEPGGESELTFAKWRRRIERWSRGASSRDRFVVLLDGLNETSGKPWAEVLRILLPAVRELGGVVVATSRRVYWDREVASRLSFETVLPVHVGDYSNDEFADIMGKNNVALEELTPRVNAFMRNPRICSLAIAVLPALAHIDDLTIDRLLLEYWRSRLRERGDLVGHSDLDFRDLLVRHAREYRERPDMDFNRDEWRTRSGAAQRNDGRNIANDLTDIEEGRFFDSDSGSYRFRRETLHFALGLLVADEMRSALRSRPEQLEEAMASILDPIRGFDIVSDIMTAAIATATLDQNCPDKGITALVLGWLSLQNLSDEAFDGLLPYITARPDPFLDAFEARNAERDDGRYLQMLFEASDREGVGRALKARINRWLGSWTRLLSNWGDSADQNRRQQELEARIERNLAALTDEERGFFKEHCVQLPNAPALVSAVANYLTGLPQAEFAPGLIAFALTLKVVGASRAYEDLAWAIRLNRMDHVELSAAVRREAVRFSNTEASPLAKDAAAAVLRMLGTLDADRDAQQLNPAQFSRTFDKEENTPDPLDPMSDGRSDADQVTAQLANTAPTAFWNHMSTTAEDHDLDRNRDYLIRFDPDGVLDVFDGIARTVSDRTGLPLRQLGWHLPWLSPILSEESLAAIRTRIADLGMDPSLAPEGDVQFITGMLVEAALPSLDAAEQIDLMLSLPPDANFYVRYIDLLKPLPAEVAVARLQSLHSGEPRLVERMLLAMASAPGPLSQALRKQVIDCLGQESTAINSAAAAFVRAHDDAELDAAVLKRCPPEDTDLEGRAASLRSAFAEAIARRQRVDLVEEIPDEHLDWVAARLPAAREPLADMIEAIIDRLARPIAVEAPSEAIITLEVENDPATSRYNLVDRGEKFDNPMEGLAAELADTTGQRFTRRRQLLTEQLNRFLTGLASEGALVAAKRPYTMALADLASEQRDRYAAWLRSILAVRDEGPLRHLQNLGFVLAQNYARIDADLAGKTFMHLWSVEPHVTVLVGNAKHPIRDLALFSMVPSPEIELLREQAFEAAASDKEIEGLVMAAEGAYARPWLDNFVATRLASVFPADQALALTVASYRPKNAQSDAVLSQDWGGSFLGGAARSGNIRYRQAERAEHWFERAAEANDKRDRWRYLQLAIACSDRRQVLSSHLFEPKFVKIGGDFQEQLIKAADRASKEGTKTLLGSRKPTRH